MNSQQPTRPLYFALFCAAAVGIGFVVFEFMADFGASTFVPILVLTVATAFFIGLWLARRRWAAFERQRFDRPPDAQHRQGS
ncbi:MAG: hypothetical protein ACJ8A4_02325 [Microvirga sp.]|jgi:hypothetical protein